MMVHFPEALSYPEAIGIPPLDRYQFHSFLADDVSMRSSAEPVGTLAKSTDFPPIARPL